MLRGLATVDATIRTTIARVIGITVTAVGQVATSVSSSTVQSVNAWTQPRRRLDVQRPVSVVPRASSVTNDATMKTITAAATGTVATVVEQVATQGSSLIATLANVWIRQRQLSRQSAAAPAKPRAGRVTNVVTMEITTVVAAGTVVTAVVKVATSTSILTVHNASATMLRKRKSVRRTERVVSPLTWAMDVATMLTTTVAAIGTTGTAAGRVTINFNTRTAKHASAWIRRLWKNVRVTVEVQTTKVTATVM